MYADRFTFPRSRFAPIQRLRFCLAVAMLALLCGCATVGPDYSGVRPDAPQAWETEMDKGLQATRPKNSTMTNWWKALNDPVLNRLERRAVTGNLDLRSALSRLRQARIKRGISSSGQFPALEGSGQFQRQHIRENSGPPNGGEELDYYNAQFDSSWELDIFGGIRRSVEAAQAELEASRAGVSDVLTSLMAEVALNYIEVRTFQQRLQITKANIDTQKKTYELNTSRYEAGLTNELAVQQSLRNLEQTRARVAQLENGLQAAKNRLAILLGQSPGSLKSQLQPVRPLPEVPAEVAVGIPAEAMRRRPDIQQAERELAAQTARIGVATAQLYPKFHLLGTIGLEALVSGSDFLSSQSMFWNIGPGVSWNIFRGRELRLNIDLQTEEQQQALIAYKSTVLNAQGEIETALTAYAKEQLRQNALEKAVAAAQRTEEVARDQYKAGLVDFYNVLDAQRSLLELEDELIQSQGEVASNLARLYKALGGGWSYPEKQAAGLDTPVQKVDSPQEQ
ncbi:MAG: efflux transporter outer membrane subunit [Thermodesulfobacteriota bacterium]